VTKLGYTLGPSGHQPSLPLVTAAITWAPFILTPRPNFLPRGFSGLPMYPSTATFDINPAFPEEPPPPPTRRLNFSYHRDLNGVTTFAGVPSKEGREYYQRFVPFASEVVGHEQEFITSPPLTQVMMSVGPEGNGAAILRVHDGIRVGDLARCQKRMLPNAQFSNVWWHFGKESSGELSGA